MDISYWTALNPNIQLLDTMKPMRGCICRLGLQVQGVGFIRYNLTDKALDFAVKKSNLMTVSRGSRKHAVIRRMADPPHSMVCITQSDIKLLRIIRDLRHDPDNTMPSRIETPNINFYSNDPNQLRDLAEKVRYDKNQHIVSIMLPANERAKQLLQDNFVLRRRPPEFQYRIIMRGGIIGYPSKQSLLALINNFGKDELHAPPVLLTQLSNSRNYMWPSYLYVNDPRLATMVALIDSRLVERVEEFCQAPT